MAVLFEDDREAGDAPGPLMAGQPTEGIAPEPTMSRRRLLTSGAGFGAALLLPGVGAAWLDPALARPPIRQASPTPTHAHGSSDSPSGSSSSTSQCSSRCDTEIASSEMVFS